VGTVGGAILGGALGLGAAWGLGQALQPILMNSSQNSGQNGSAGSDSSSTPEGSNCPAAQKPRGRLGQPMQVPSPQNPPTSIEGPTGDNTD
jgi:hypothetical protein